MTALSARAFSCVVLLVAAAGCQGEGTPAERLPKPDVCPGFSNQSDVFPGAAAVGDSGVSLTVEGRPASNYLALGDRVRALLVVSDEVLGRGSLASANLEIAGTGVLDVLEWHHCHDYGSGVFVTLHPTRAGEGDVIVRVDGDEEGRFSLVVAEPVALNVTVDPSFAFEAQLEDAAGHLLYAGDFLWQFAPAPVEMVHVGNLVTTPLQGLSRTVPPEILVTVSRGDVSTSMTVGNTAEGWRIQEP